MTIYTLYIKTHKITGLKYLGKTTKDPFLYKGSGVRWLRHLNKHGKEHYTEILIECQSNEEVKQWGLHYSELYNVVESPEWANLKPESGDGGSAGGAARSPETRAKLSKAHKGRTFSPETRAKMSEARKGSVRSPKTRSKMSESAKKRGISPETFAKMSEARKVSEKRKGLIHSPETRAKISAAKKGRTFSPEHRAKLSAAIKASMTPERRAKISEANRNRSRINSVKRT